MLLLLSLLSKYDNIRSDTPGATSLEMQNPGRETKSKEHNKVTWIFMSSGAVNKKAKYEFLWDFQPNSHKHVHRNVLQEDLQINFVTAGLKKESVHFREEGFWFPKRWRTKDVVKDYDIAYVLEI